MIEVCDYQHKEHGIIRRIGETIGGLVDDLTDVGEMVIENMGDYPWYLVPVVPLVLVSSLSINATSEIINRVKEARERVKEMDKIEKRVDLDRYEQLIYVGRDGARNVVIEEYDAKKGSRTTIADIRIGRIINEIRIGCKAA